MTLDEAIAALRDLNEKVPIPMRLPTESEVAAAERTLGIQFHPDLRSYLLKASDVVFGTLEPVTIAPPAGHTNIVDVCQSAWNDMDLPRTLTPFCQDNGDYYCINKAGKIVFWSHNDSDITEEWDNLATWIEEVWIEENQ